METGGPHSPGGSERVPYSGAEAPEVVGKWLASTERRLVGFFVMGGAGVRVPGWALNSPLVPKEGAPRVF